LLKKFKKADAGWQLKTKKGERIKDQKAFKNY